MSRSGRRPLSVARPWVAKIGSLLIIGVAVEWFLFLIAPAFVLLPCRNVSVRRVYRNYLSTLQLIFFGLVSFVFEIVYSIKLTIYGGDELLERYVEKPFIIANHRTRLDWFFVICVCLRLRRLSSVKIALKKEISHIPIFGWAVQCFLFPLISRVDKDRDLATIKNCIEYHNSLAMANLSEQQNCTVVLFPEGTDLSENNLGKCREFQKTKNIPITSQVLAPKAAGFAQTLETLKDTNAIDVLLDLTFAFVDFTPLERPDERSVFVDGRFPREVQVKIDVVDWRDLPGKETSAQFLNESFAKKETLLNLFYQPLAMYHEQNNIMSTLPNEQTGTGTADENCSDCSSTQLSNLEPVLQFVDLDSTEPLEETITKDIRFVQYAINSFVIVVFLALMIHVAICFAFYSWPLQVATYATCVLVLGFFVTHVVGGFDKLELEIFKPEFPQSSERAYAQMMAHKAARRASPRRAKDCLWSSLVNAIGVPGSTARRSAYIESVRHRAGLTRTQDD